MKYNNKKVIYNGIKFDSKREMNHYIYLLELDSRGEISNLELQKKFILQEGYKINGKSIRPITYVCDFYYIKDGIEHVVDTKGFRTEVYKIKKKMFEYKYQIQIEEV